MQSPSEPLPPSAARGERAWLVLGLIAAAVLLVLRTRVLAELAILERGVEPRTAHWAAAGRMGSSALSAAVLGFSGAAILWSTRAAGLPQRALGLSIATLFGLSALTGWPVEAGLDPTILRLEPRLSSIVALAPIAFLLCLVLATLASSPPGARTLEALARPRRLALVALLLFATPLAQLARARLDPPRLLLREVVADLALERARLELGPHDAEHPPHARILCPLVDSRFDVADKPSLALPPPCEISFVVRPEEDGARLFAAAGVDLGVRGSLAGTGASLEVRFEILVDGRAELDERVTVVGEDVLRREGREAECAWRHAGAGSGIALRAGQRVTLRTSLPAYAGRELPAAARGLALGFGGLTLERDRERPRTSSSPDRPNVVLIVIDTLRADRMSCYGAEKPTTPRLDALAREGILFEQAYATSSWTWPSTASILTGLMPEEHGVVSNESCTLHLSYETLAEALQGRGFTTAAFSCNPLIAAERYFDQGFEHFDAVHGAQMRPTAEIIDEVLATLERIADTRFFLYLHLADPHTPHRPLPFELARLGGERPADFPTYEREGHLVDGLDVYAGRLMRGEGLDEGGHSVPERVVPPEHMRWIRDSYDACVGTSDHFCGVVLDALARLGLTDRTIVALTSDHGEELFDHGMLAHGHTLHQELVRVPLILAGPGVPRGKRIAREVSNRHLAPTLARVGGARLAGVRDALDLFAPEPQEQPVGYATEKGFWNGRRPLALQGLRAHGWVLHRAPRGAPFGREPGPEGDLRLFHTREDPLELLDLAHRPEHEERGRELLLELERALEEERGARRAGALGLGASALEVLRGVGYVGGDEEE